MLRILLLFAAFASEPKLSAEREPGQDWMSALEEQGFAPRSEPQDIGGIPEWRHGPAALNRLFLSALNVRHYDNPNSRAFRRKAPWLYPIDGCYAKAAHVSYIAGNLGYSRPGKIYAYGSLRARSPYARNGSTVYWSYHMAAAYHIGATVWVLDPIVNAAAPVTQAQWLAAISNNPARVQVALCDSRSYSPHSPCRGGGGNGAYLGHIEEFLRLEWSNLLRLGFSPVDLLGP